MDEFLNYVRDKILWWVLLVFSLSAGIVGAYGRERHEGRAPDAQWWKNRLYIMPFLAITSSFLTDQFKLSNQQTAMAASLLSLLGYEAVRMISERAKKRGAQAGAAFDAVMGSDTAAAPRPYHSIVDVDDKGRAVAHVEPTDDARPRRGAIGAALREAIPRPNDADEDQQALINRLNDVI